MYRFNSKGSPLNLLHNGTGYRILNSEGSIVVSFFAQKLVSICDFSYFLFIVTLFPVKNFLSAHLIITYRTSLEKQKYRNLGDVILDLDIVLDKKLAGSKSGARDEWSYK